MGAKVLAPKIFQLLDMSNNGTLSRSEVRFLGEHPDPASFDALDALREFIVANCHGVDGALRDFFIRGDTNGSGQCNFREFKRALSDLGYQGGDELQLFTALDVARTGTLDYTEYSVLTLVSAWHHLKCVDMVRNAMEEAYGSMQSAFRTMDA